MGKKILFTLLTGLIFLAILETASRLIEAAIPRSVGSPEQNRGWQAEFFKSFLDWHEPDPDLLWRYKANLDNPLIRTNSDHLLGSEMAPEKASSTIRILLLGDSSPVGLGLKTRQQAFGEVLRYLLELEYLGSKRVELVNAAVSGYTSEQIARFLSIRGWLFEPDIVLLYCGNNDASISGSFHDHELLEDQKLRAVREILCRLAFYRILRNLLTRSAEAGNDLDLPLTVRVVPERFQENLEDIAAQCAAHRCPLIILKPPVPYFWPAGLQFRLFAHITGEKGQLLFPNALRDILGRKIKYCINKDQLAQIYGDADVFTRSVYASVYSDTMNPQDAIEYYLRLSEKERPDPVILNNLGVSYWENGQYDLARQHLDKARTLYARLFGDFADYGLTAAGSPFLYNIGITALSQTDQSNDTTSQAFTYLDSALQADYLSLRIKREYRENIDKFKDHEFVTVIDLPTIFKENGGEKLFVDHCHPTAEGHVLIAESILDAIKRHGLLLENRRP